MGDRSNIAIVQPDGSKVFLYGHWMGEDSIRIAHDVLARKERWNDHAYLARMLFSKMVEGDLEGDTGYGISNTLCDNEYPIIVINPHSQSVWLDKYNWGNSESFAPITAEVSMDEFVNASSVSSSFADLAVNMGSKLVPA
jgi:hypothetical protein